MIMWSLSGCEKEAVPKVAFLPFFRLTAEEAFALTPKKNRGRCPGFF
jgi:hypothetical protein